MPGLPQIRREKKSGLVPELKQMFVVISGDFLVFLLQEKERERRKKTLLVELWVFLDASTFA